MINTNWLRSSSKCGRYYGNSCITSTPLCSSHHTEGSNKADEDDPYLQRSYCLLERQVLTTKKATPNHYNWKVSAMILKLIRDGKAYKMGFYDLLMNQIEVGNIYLLNYKQLDRSALFELIQIRILKSPWEVIWQYITNQNELIHTLIELSSKMQLQTRAGECGGENSHETVHLFPKGCKLGVL